MAKRAPKDEKPYQPVDEALIQGILSGPRLPTFGRPALERVPLERPSLPKDPPIESAPGLEPTRVRPETRPTPETPDQDDSAGLPEHRLSREKRVLLTETEEASIEDLVARIARELGTPVKLSHVLRATIAVLLHAEESLFERARKTGRIKRPPNNDPMALYQYEQVLARLLDSAVRGAPPMR